MHEDLFTQAEELAEIDPGRPKQVNLRRAVSSTYYAVFHYLVHEACCIVMGKQSARAASRYVIGRAFTHNTMKLACNSFGGGNLKKSAIKGLPLDAQGNYLIPPAIRAVSKIFVELQQKRQLADYDRNEQFKRSDVMALIGLARNAVGRFAGLTSSKDKRFFLACLWAWKELANR